MSDLEQNIKVMEKVIENLHKELDEVKDILKMHIRMHMADLQPIHVYNKVDISNGFSYNWGSYYRVPTNGKVNYNGQESQIQPGEAV